MTPPAQNSKHAATLGPIRLVYKKRTGTLTYVQRGGHQSAVDKNGVSLDTYIHALYGMISQRPAKSVLMIGCGGGSLGKMLFNDGKRVTIADIDKSSFVLAKQHFGLPPEITCVVADGLAFMQETRARFDVVVVDAFIGEKIPKHMTGDALCHAVRRCLKRGGRLFMNVCLHSKSDLTADALALRFKASGLHARLLDQRGAQRNAIVLAGNVKGIRKPRLQHVPQAEVSRLKRELKGSRFRRLKRPQ